MLQSKPIRSAIRWQVYAIAAIALSAAALGGWHAALSGLLGGLVNVVATVVFALVVGISRSDSPTLTLMTMVRAEASKIALIVLQLWLTLTMYRDIVPAAFFAAFVVTVVLSSLAFFVRD